MRMLTSISVTARSTDRSVRAAWCGHSAGGGVGRTGWTMKPFQGHFCSASGSPKTLSSAQFWLLAADDVLPTFCQGGGCQPSTSQMKQPRGAGANAHTEQPGLLEGPTSPPWATWLQKHQILGGGFNLWFLKVKKKKQPFGTSNLYSKHTKLGWNLNSPRDLKTLLLRVSVIVREVLFSNGHILSSLASFRMK